MAAIEFANTVADLLQKAPVVGDEHDGALECIDLLLQPVNGGDVEMVGRLIEEQDVGLYDQGARQCGTPTPAARQGRKSLISIEVKLLKYFLDALRH